MIAPILVAWGVLATGLAWRRARSLARAAQVRHRLPTAPASRPMSAGRFEAPGWFVIALGQAGLDRPDPAGWWRAWLGIGGLLVVVAVTVVGIGGGIVAMALAVAVPQGVLWSMRGRGDTQYETAVPALLDDVAAELRAGSSLVVALGEAGARSPGPLGADLRGVVEAVGRGGSFLDELARWAERRPLAAVRLATTALAVGATTGGRQARAVESVSTTLRERSAVRREASSLATQSRASALVMAVTPIVFAVAASTLDPRVGHVLAHTPLGIGCLVGGLTLEAVAALWMRRITGANP